MAELFQKARDVATVMENLKPGETAVLEVPRWMISQSLMQQFLPRVLIGWQPPIDVEQYTFNYEQDATKPAQDVVPITIVRSLAVQQ